MYALKCVKLSGAEGMHSNHFMMFYLFFILFNDWNSLAIDQHIFQSKNNFNSNKIKCVHLENVIFIHFNICPLVTFATLSLFLQAFAMEPF